MSQPVGPAEVLLCRSSCPNTRSAEDWWETGQAVCCKLRHTTVGFVSGALVMSGSEASEEVAEILNSCLRSRLARRPLGCSSGAASSSGELEPAGGQGSLKGRPGMPGTPSTPCWPGVCEACMAAALMGCKLQAHGSHDEECAWAGRQAGSLRAAAWAWRVLPRNAAASQGRE